MQGTETLPSSLPSVAQFLIKGVQVGVDSGVCKMGLTYGHESHDQLGIGDVGTSHAGPTHSLADIRIHTAHLICRRQRSSWSCDPAPLRMAQYLLSGTTGKFSPEILTLSKRSMGK